MHNGQILTHMVVFLSHSCVLTLEPYDSGTLHNVILSTLVENARVNPRTRNPDPRTLTTNIDPPQFLPSRKKDITLPRSDDLSSKWIWVSKWSVLHDQEMSDIDGWRFAQRWDTPENEWVPRPTLISPISRSGLVARRRWFRIMKKVPIEYNYVGCEDLSDNEDAELPQDTTDFETRRLGKSSTPARNQPARANSMGAKLVNLMAGISKGK